jgi:hypothetical protein
MRNSSFEVSLLGLAITACLAPSIPLQAQLDPVPLLSWNSTWLYLDTGTNLLRAWRTNDFDDSSWLSGPGIFGYEPDTSAEYNPYGGGIATSLSRYCTYLEGVSTQVTNYYFRTIFEWPPTAGSPTNYYLAFFNVVDDGIYVYLNGMPLYGLGVASNAAATAFATRTSGAWSATAAPPFEGSNEVVHPLPGAYLRADEPNLVAVELHQVSATSSDAVFGMTLVAMPYEPIVLTSPPTGANLSVGATLRLAVGATGTAPWYQWYQVTNGVTNLVIQSGATNILTLANVDTNRRGAYFAVVTNPVTRLQTPPVTVSVTLDPLTITQQPQAAIAVPQSTATNITLNVSGSTPSGKSSYKWYRWTATPIYGTNVIGGVTNITIIDYLNYTNSVSGSTSNTLKLTVTASAVGNYFCVITNALGTLTSGVCRVRLVPDQFGPVLLQALIEYGSPDVVKLTFNENLITNNDPQNPMYDFSAWNLANYHLYYLDPRGAQYCTPVVPGQGGFDEVTNVVSSKTVYLRATFPWDPTRDYLVLVNNVADTKTNGIAPYGWIPIQWTETNTIVPFADAWQWNQSIASQSDFDAYLTPAWTALDYDDTANNWYPGQALFWYNYDNSIPAFACTAAGDMATPGIWTYYFRHHFYYDTTLQSTNVTGILQYVLNGGAIFYLNGVEIARVNMGPGVPAWFRLPPQPSGANCGATLTNLNLGYLLNNGDNVLAVENHQSAGFTDATVAFDASLNFRVVHAPPDPQSAHPSDLKILKKYDEASQRMTLYYTNTALHGLVITAAADLGDPYNPPVWLPLQPAATNMTVSLTNRSGFYRLQQFR